MDEKAFYTQFASKSTKGRVLTLIILCFLNAAFSVVPIAFGNLYFIIDLVIGAAFGALLILRKKWYFTLAISIYIGFMSIINLALFGSFSGWLVILAAIVSTVGLKKLDKAYKLYKQYGVLPAGLVSS